MKLTDEKEPMSTSGHPTEASVQKRTDSPTSISLGKRERALLKYVYNNPDLRFNVRAYSRLTGIPRGTIYHIINSLTSKGLLINPSMGIHNITEKGKATTEITAGVHVSRRECPGKKENLSLHYHKFKFSIKDKSGFSKELIKRINPLDYKENRLSNLHQHFLYFEDATIIINPKKIIITIHDTIAEDVDEADIKALSKVTEYAKRMLNIGIEVGGVMLEEGHWARIESHLADFLEKIDGRYFLDLGKGKKFWIDHSPPHRIEDETNDKQIRERMDTFLTDALNTDVLLSDVDKVVKALGFLTKIECARLKSQIPKPIKEESLSKAKPSYIG